MMITLGRTVAALGVVGLFLFSGPELDDRSGWACAAPSVSSIEQALTQVTSEDESVREAAIRLLIEQGDASLVPRLEEIRANADRSIRQAIKPLMDLLKNRAKLTSPNTDVRRSAATDLGSVRESLRRFRGWMQPAVNEPNKWVRYTMEESAALIKLASDDSSIKAAAAEKLGELRSQNGVPVMKELVAGRRWRRGDRSAEDGGESRRRRDRTY